MKPTRLTDELIEKVAAVVQRGNFRKTAFAQLGIPKKTWVHWMRVGKAVRADQPTPNGESEAHGELCAELVRRLEMVEAQVEDDLLVDIQEKAKQDWRAGAWYLERRHNKKYSRNPHAHWDDEEAVEVKIDAKEMLREKLERLLERMGGDE